MIRISFIFLFIFILSGCATVKKQSDKEMIKQVIYANAKMSDCQGSFYRR